MDEHDGKGGSYVMVDGKRQLVERTEEHQLGNRPRDADGKPLDGQERELPVDGEEHQLPQPVEE